MEERHYLGHVSINQLIESKIPFKHNFYLDWNFWILFRYLAMWYEVEPTKCKHHPYVTKTNKIRASCNEMNF